MAETLIPADAEVAFIAELDSRFPALGYDALAVGTKIPGGTKPNEFVRVLAVGGNDRDIANDQVTVVLEGWSTSEGKARRICAFALAAIQAAGRDGSIGGVPAGRARTVSFPANLPHPTITTHFRFTATVSVSLRREAV